MPIVASLLVEDMRQIDGRRHVHERHTDQRGQTYDVLYMAEPQADAQAAMLARVPSLDAGLVSGEISRNVGDVLSNGSLAAPSFWYSAPADNVAALRAAYASATQTQAVMAGDYLNTLTDAQLRTAFNLTQAQVTALRTNKLAPASSLAASLRAAVGA